MVNQFVGLDVSQKMTAICVVDNAGRGVWRGQCPTAPEQIAAMVVNIRGMALGLPQQYHARIRGDAPAIKSGGDLLAANGWKREREKAIFDHGASMRWREGSVQASNKYTKSASYATSASPKSSPLKWTPNLGPAVKV